MKQMVESRSISLIMGKVIAQGSATAIKVSMHLISKIRFKEMKDLESCYNLE